MKGDPLDTKTVRFYVNGERYGAVDVPVDQAVIEDDGDVIVIDAAPVEIRGKTYEARTEG